MKYTVAVLQKYQDSHGDHFEVHNYRSKENESKEMAKTNAIKYAIMESNGFSRYYDDVEFSSNVLGIVAVYPIIEEKDIPTEIQNGDFEERMDYMYNLTVKEEEYADFIKYDKKKAFSKI